MYAMPNTPVAQEYIPDLNPYHDNRYAIRSSKNPNFQTPQSSYVPHFSASNQPEVPYNQQPFFLMHTSQQSPKGKKDVHLKDKFYPANSLSNQPHGNMQIYGSNVCLPYTKPTIDIGQGGQLGPLSLSQMLSHIGRPGMKRNSNTVSDPKKLHEGDFNFTPNTEGDFNTHWYE